MQRIPFIRLAPAEKRALSRLVATTRDADLLRRAQSLLWIDAGEPVGWVAKRVVRTRANIYVWLRRFKAMRGRSVLERLSDHPRTGRPASMKNRIAPLLSGVLESDPKSFGYGKDHWTRDLLLRYLKERHACICSPDTITDTLKRMGYVWMYPRYRLKAAIGIETIGIP